MSARLEIVLGTGSLIIRITRGSVARVKIKGNLIAVGIRYEGENHYLPSQSFIRNCLIVHTTEKYIKFTHLK